MATGVDNTELTDAFEEFYRNYYRNEIGELAQKYPNDQKSLWVDWRDLYRFDSDLADDVKNRPAEMQDYAEEALRLYDLPVDVKLGQAHVRFHNLPDATDIRKIRHEHHGTLLAVQGIVRKATDVRPKVTTAAFECQRCGTLTRIPQVAGDFQEPHECQGCERQGPFRLNMDQSEFVDAQKIRVQESPEGLRGGETPQSIDVSIEDDITGEVTAGDHVRVTGILKLDQQGDDRNKSPMFDLYMEGVDVSIEDEQFEDMDITDEDKKEIIELSNEDDLYDKMVGAIAPSIYGYEREKLAMMLQLFSGVTKHLPDGSRIRGDLHMLLIGDPGTGKCIDGDTRVTLSDGATIPIRELVEANLEDPKSIDDGVWDTVDFEVPSLQQDGTLAPQRATKVWKREAPEHLYRIRTAMGRKVDVTPSHPLFVHADGRFEVTKAEELAEGDQIACGSVVTESEPATPTVSDGGAEKAMTDRIKAIECVEPEDDWVYDLEVEGTHNYLTNGIISHNSQMLSYIQNIAPRSVYTSGKGSSSAGLTAAAVRDDFGEGQQWTLEAGALVLADLGIAAVDELDKMRCVTGDTLVHLGDRLTKIRDFAHEAARDGEIEQLPNGRTIRDIDATAWTMTDAGRIETRPVTAIHEYEAPDDLVEVTLDTGESVTATADHPFFVLEGGNRVEKSAEDLTDGDWVYVPRHLHETASDGGSLARQSRSTNEQQNGVSSPIAKILGYLAGDGNLYYNCEEGVYGIRFINSEEELLRDFEHACRDGFDAETVRPQSEQRSDGVQTVRLPGKGYADRVIDAGMNLETYEGKTLPEAVSRSSRSSKAAFLRALADAEGSVGERNVKVHSASYELLLGTKHLLLEFGISSQIQHCERPEKRDLYILAITDADSLAAFDDHIGFTLGRKQSALNEVIETVGGERTVLDVIPEIGELLAEYRKSLRLYQSECGITDSTYCNFENGDANVSIRAARSVLEAFENRKQTARRRYEELEVADWERLARIRTEFHCSQADIAAATDYTQQEISRKWGFDDTLKMDVRGMLRDILSEISETDLSPLRQFVHGDVKWRQVGSVEQVSPAHTDAQVSVLTKDIADLLNCSPEDATERARELVATDPDLSDWECVRDAIEQFDVSMTELASDLDVHQSTVSRWVREIVETDRFQEVKRAALDRIVERKHELEDILDRIDARGEPRVYDLTIEGTHNFVANGMVVHNSEDRSAMHQALEQQEISINKAGINATLKSRCSLLGAANPKYGRFDQFEPIGEQIDLEPALISRFDLIFTVTDKPDEEEDRELASHIIQTNYAGELHTHREENPASDYSQEEVESVTDEVAPTIEPELLRKYVAHAKTSCFPTMTEEAKAEIEDFYVDLRVQGTDEDAAVPVTARKLEALVRLSEASARIRLSDTVEQRDAERATSIARYCMEQIGVDPETGEFDADVVETGTSKSQRDRIQNIKGIIADIESEYDEGAPIDVVAERAEEVGIDESQTEHEIEKLKQKGEVYEPRTDHLRTT